MAAEIARDHGGKDDAPVTTRVASSSVDDDRARAVERKSFRVPHRRTDPSETLDPVRRRAQRAGAHCLPIRLSFF